MTGFNIQITSDTVCPWCFIGYRRLLNGIRTFQSNDGDSGKAHQFSIEWSPFYLNPKAPEKSIAKSESYAQKFGPGRAEQMFRNLSAVGESAGIHFSFGGNTGKTRDSHRLIAWAKTQDAAQSDINSLQSHVAEQLFSSYFEKEEDITTHEVLSAAYLRAVAAHSPDANQDEAKTKVDKFLASNELGHDVDNEAELARKGGITGVPHFLINDRFEISGGQEPAAFVALFQRVLKLEEKNGNV